MKKFILSLIAAMIIVPGAALANSDTSKVKKAKYRKASHTTKDIVDIAASNETFSTLVAAVKAADLVKVLKSDGPFTVLAPTNEAFAKLPKGTVESLLKPENKDMLIKVLTYHVIPANAKAADVVKMSRAKTVQGENIKITVKDGGVVLNGTTNVIKTDISASNGTIHVIDSVLMPLGDIVGVAASTNTFNTLIAAVKAAGLVDTLKSDGPFTVLAPNDAAFAKLPKGTVESLLKPENKDMLVKILTYHVIPGEARAATVVTLKKAKTVQGGNIWIKVKKGNVYLNGKTKVIATDIDANNGVVHVIDSVLMPK